MRRCLLRALVACAMLVALTPEASATATSHLLGRVHESLTAWRLHEAEALLSLMTVALPRHTEVRRAQARLAYLRGEYDEAARLVHGLPLVWGTTDMAGLTRAIEAARAETRGWVTRRSRSGHFLFLCPPGLDELILPYAEEALDRAKATLGADLGLWPDGPVRVEILPGPVSLARLSPLTEDEVRRTGTIALSHDRKLMAVTPRALLSGYAWLDTLSHEYVHYVLEVSARGRVPLWLHEGLARFAQARWRRPFPTEINPGEAHLLADALASDSLVPIARMMPSFAKLRDQREASLAYAQVTSMVLHVQAHRGIKGLRELIAQLALGRSMDESLRRLVGVDLRGFTERWRRDLGRQPPRRLPHYDHPALRFKDASLAASPPAPAMPAGPVARHRRIGALLRAQGRPEAARLAFERAFHESGRSHGRIGNTLARLLLELKRPVEAARVASFALRFHEDLAALHVALARAEEARGRLAEAEAAWRSANAVDPFDPEIHCALARLLGARPASAEESARERAFCGRLRAEESAPLK